MNLQMGGTMPRDLARRLTKLEAALGGRTQAAWAARVGWSQLYEWDALLARRARAKMLPVLGIESDPTPPESALERQYHEDMANQFPPELGRDELVTRLLGRPA